MFKQKQWLAVVRGNHWVVAKVARRKFNMDILHLAELSIESEPEQDFGEQTANKPVDDQVQTGEILLEPKESAPPVERPKVGKGAVMLKTWLDRNRVPIQQLKLAVSCPGVITRMITLPLMSAQDLDKLLTLHVDQYFTLNISDYVVDYRVLDRITEDGETRQRVLLAALPKYQWESLWSEWESIGLKPKVVDLAADSLARLYSQLILRRKNIKSKAEAEASLDLAIVELNADRVEFVLLEQGVFFLYSDLEVSLDELDQVALAVKRAAEERGQGPQLEDENSDLQTARLHAWARAEIELTLGNVLQSVAEFFSFFAARHFGKSIDRIYLTGDYADLPFIQEIFESNLDVYTRVGFPDAWRPSFNKKTKTHRKNGMKYGSLYGLALREG